MMMSLTVHVLQHTIFSVTVSLIDVGLCGCVTVSLIDVELCMVMWEFLLVTLSRCTLAKLVGVSLEG